MAYNFEDPQSDRLVRELAAVCGHQRVLHAAGAAQNRAAGRPIGFMACLAREERMSRGDAGLATRLLATAAQGWSEIPPTDRVRDQAMRLLRLHQLRAADVLQLAAALVLAEHDPRTLPFVTLDAQLARAAEREGFEVIGG